MIGLQLVQVGKIRTQACVSQAVKTAQSNRALAMLASPMCLWAICIEKTESQDNWYLVGCIVVLIRAWEGLKTLVVIDTSVFYHLPEDTALPEATIEPQVIPAAESIPTHKQRIRKMPRRSVMK